MKIFPIMNKIIDFFKDFFHREYRITTYINGNYEHYYPITNRKEVKKMIKEFKKQNIEGSLYKKGRFFLEERKIDEWL